MTGHRSRHDKPVHDELHPDVYRAMLGLTVWLVLSVWAFFDRGVYVGLTLTMITVFFVVAVGIPVIIWLVWRQNVTPVRGPSVSESFRDWRSHRFATWTGRLNGWEAAVQILLPIAAVSLGMTIFGLVFYFDVPQSGY